mgnify:CR=1 FL=1
MKFNPWEDLPADAPFVNVSAPPCAHCKHWSPQVLFRPTPFGIKSDGVRLCHSEDMHHDFSCYKPKDA